MADVGIHRVCDRIRANIFIPGLRNLYMDIATCPLCQQSKASRQKRTGYLQPINAPTVPFLVITMDFIVGLPPSRTG